jgi:predicted transcriptional regulator
MEMNMKTVSISDDLHHRLTVLAEQGDATPVDVIAQALDLLTDWNTGRVQKIGRLRA